MSSRLAVSALLLLACGATAGAAELTISRAEYAERLQGFWLGQCIANWTGLVTEMDRVEPPFYTDDDWGTTDRPNIWGNLVGHSTTIDFYFVTGATPWGADDDTDIEYLYQHLLTLHATALLTPEQIRDGWLRHIYSNEDAPLIRGPDGSLSRENFLWVSNERAYYLMKDEGLLPPATSHPANNPDFDMIDAQLSTEIFGLFAPGRPDLAVHMARLPIRTTASRESEWIARFYVSMHAHASAVDPELPAAEKIRWMADAARSELPADSYPAKMFDFVRQSYERNPDGTDWEMTRDAVYRRYQRDRNDGYVYKQGFDAGINFAASLVSLFYGGGDLKETIRIGSLAGWDSDNPTATWGGLLGFMAGRAGVERAFGREGLSTLYSIHRTRRRFPDRTPGSDGEDSFEQMARRGLAIVDRVVIDLAGGRVDGDSDTWRIPVSGAVAGGR